MNVRIIVGGRFDYIKYSYIDQNDLYNLIYFDNDTRLSQSFSLIEKLKFSFIRLTEQNSDLRNIKENYREYFPIDKLKKYDKIIFLLYEMNLMASDIKSIRTIKGHFPNARFVLFFTNTIGSVREDITINLLKNKNLYDLIYTFSRRDAKRYNLLHMKGGLFPYSPIHIQPDDRYSSDLFFCGKDKGRLQHLKFLARTLINKGIKCIFIVYKDCDTDDSLYDTEIKDGIITVNKSVSYFKVLKYIYNTKCLFEYSTSAVPTLRYSEAIAYGKKLITNAKDIQFDELYRPSQFMVYEDISSDEIVNFIKTPLNVNEIADTSAISTDKYIKELVNKLF